MAVAESEPYRSYDRDQRPTRARLARFDDRERARGLVPGPLSTARSPPGCEVWMTSTHAGVTPVSASRSSSLELVPLRGGWCGSGTLAKSIPRSTTRSKRGRR